ncbi:MAG: RidA family protein [Myxococcota bacterium]
MSEPTEPHHTIVSTSAAPAAIGPYSQAVQAGPMTFISGQIPLDPQTGEIVGTGDVAAQTRRVMANLLAIVDAAGHRPHEIVRCTIFLKSLSDFQIVNGIYAEALGGHRPARATVEVARLPRDVLVEIDAICVRA